MNEVCVVIPTFNRRGTLVRALDSVARQTFHAWELIVVDDGSTDDTADVFEEWKARQSGPQVLRYIRCTNSGVAAARNLGVQHSTSPWLAFLDSDDEWLPQKLERQFRLTPHFKLIHGEEIWIRNGQRVNKMKKHAKSGGDVFERCVELCFISPSTSLIEKNLFNELGGFDPSFPVCEDYDLWLRVAVREPVGFINEPVIHKFGGHADQLSLKFHSMDFYRVRALRPFMAKYEFVARAIESKCVRLQRGFLKYGKLDEAAQVEEWRAEARKVLTQLQMTHSAAERLPLSVDTLVR